MTVSRLRKGECVSERCSPHGEVVLCTGDMIGVYQREDLADACVEDYHRGVLKDTLS